MGCRNKVFNCMKNIKNSSIRLNISIGGIIILITYSTLSVLYFMNNIFILTWKSFTVIYNFISTIKNIRRSCLYFSMIAY